MPRKGNPVTRICGYCNRPFKVDAWQRTGKGGHLGIYCSRACYRTATELPVAVRLARHTIILPGPDGCHEWTGNRTPSGYGQISVRNERGEWVTKRVHRVTWEIEKGLIPPGIRVCHRCDNPPCRRLDHLFLGTDADNNHDRRTKGRYGHGYIRDGIKHPHAKLTEDDVRDIRVKYVPHIVSLQMLADEYGLTNTTVFAIVHRKTWKHVD